jgi:hypothetical protein
MAKITPKATGVSRPAIAMPATAASPKPATIRVTIACPTGVAKLRQDRRPGNAKTGPMSATTPVQRCGPVKPAVMAQDRAQRHQRQSPPG